MRIARLKRLFLIALLVAFALPTLPSATASTGTPIFGTAQLTAKELAAWFESTGYEPKLSDGTSILTLASYFIQEGAAEGIRGDIAFAQSVHETGFFQYGGQVERDDNNFAGLGAVDGGNNPATFASVQYGVRAQIHHLRAYADAGMVVYRNNISPEPPVLSNPVVIPTNGTAPRFTLFEESRFGSAPNWEDLTGRWASDPQYDVKVLGMYTRITEHALFLRGAIPLSGDWNGDGTDTPGWYAGGRFYLRNANSAGNADLSFWYGIAGDVPVVGDWDGNGTDTVGILRGGDWHLRNTNSGGVAHLTFRYGRLESGDYPITGDWNGDGTDTVGIVRGGDWHLRNVNRGGVADIVFRYGRILAGDVPVVGDWNGDDTDTPGIRRGREWHLRNSNNGGVADRTFLYGLATDKPVVGDWDGGHGTTVGVVRGSGWLLRNANNGGGANIEYFYTGS